MRDRTNDDLCTPVWLLDLVRQVGPIALDPCSNPWSSVGAPVELDGTEGKDGLAADWKATVEDGAGLVFCNPPYGRGHMPKWAAKIVEEAKSGAEIVALVKGDHSTIWWAWLRRRANAIAYLNRRVAFVGGNHGSGNFASAVLYFGRRPHLFAYHFAADADVRVLAA